MNNPVHLYLDTYQKGACTLHTLVRNILLCEWVVEEVKQLHFRLTLSDYSQNRIPGKNLIKYLPSQTETVQVEQVLLPHEAIQLFYDYTAILDFEDFLYKKYPHFTDLDFKYISQYEYFWFVFDADETYTHTQWLLAPSKEYFFMPAVFTSEDLAQEFLTYPHLPEPEPYKERYILQTNGTRLFAMLGQMPIDQIAVNPCTVQKTLYLPPDFTFMAKLS